MTIDATSPGWSRRSGRCFPSRRRTSCRIGVAVRPTKTLSTRMPLGLTSSRRAFARAACAGEQEARGRGAENERYVKMLHRIYPVDPLLKSVPDEILASNLWELKLLGMQMTVEGLAVAAFNVMRPADRRRDARPTARLRPAERGAARQLRLLRPARSRPRRPPRRSTASCSRKS